MLADSIHNDMEPSEEVGALAATLPSAKNLPGINTLSPTVMTFA